MEDQNFEITEENTNYSDKPSISTNESHKQHHGHSHPPTSAHSQEEVSDSNYSNISISSTHSNSSASSTLSSSAHFQTESSRSNSQQNRTPNIFQRMADAEAERIMVFGVELHSRDDKSLSASSSSSSLSSIQAMDVDPHINSPSQLPSQFQQNLQIHPQNQSDLYKRSFAQQKQLSVTLPPLIAHGQGPGGTHDTLNLSPSGSVSTPNVLFTVSSTSSASSNTSIVSTTSSPNILQTQLQSLPHFSELFSPNFSPSAYNRRPERENYNAQLDPNKRQKLNIHTAASWTGSPLNRPSPHTSFGASVPLQKTPSFQISRGIDANRPRFQQGSPSSPNLTPPVIHGFRSLTRSISAPILRSAVRSSDYPVGTPITSSASSSSADSSPSSVRRDYFSLSPSISGTFSPALSVSSSFSNTSSTAIPPSSPHVNPSNSNSNPNNAPLNTNASINANPPPSKRAAKTTITVRWMKHYSELKEFKEKFGNCNASRKNPTWKTLGHWVRQQRRKKRQGKLSTRQIEMLDQLGFEWDRSYYSKPRSGLLSVIKEDSDQEMDETEDKNGKEEDDD